MSKLLITALLLVTWVACSPPETTTRGDGSAADEPTTASADASAGDAGMLLRDDFSDPGSGWTVRDRGAYRNAYADGRYLLRVDNAASSYVFNVAYHPAELADVRIEVDATRLAGPPNAGVGLDCRRAGADQTGTYYADVSGDGEARIVAQGDEQEVLAEAERTGLWRAGANRLRFDCVGETLTLWLNGERLLSATDSRYERGRIGLRAGGGSGAATEVAFDDLSVTAP